jgi:uncharacterized protein (TIGR04551 family)
MQTCAHTKTTLVALVALTITSAATLASAQAPETQPVPPAADSETAEGDPAEEAPAVETDLKFAPGETSSEIDDELNRLIDEASQDSSLQAWTDERAEREPVFPRLEHHGYFRFRTDVFWNGHLGLSLSDQNEDIRTTAIPPPLRENQINNDDVNPWFTSDGGASEDARTLASANIRFRYRPTFHVSRSMRIHGSFDFLDNVVLGSTPDFAGNLGRPDVPLVAFTSTQVPPTGGVNGWKDSVAVKEAYAEWQPAFLLRAGRMASHWGLGILANGGQDIDDDYGDYADRVMLGLKLYGVYIFAAYDFVYSGFTTDAHGDLFGQPMDLGTDDNVHQAVLSVLQRPLSPEEKAQREIAYRERFEPIFDWGFYGVFRTQALDSAGYHQQWIDNGGYGQSSYSGAQLMPRDAWAVVPDLWLRYMQRFDYFSGIRIELEAAAVVGHVGAASDDATTATKDRDIQQFAAALEIEYDYKELTFGVHTGFATGDSAAGFGLKPGDEALYEAGLNEDGDKIANEEITAFKFDRNYHVDLLMFREMVGTVTNAFYLRPFVAYDLFDSVEDALGARLDLIYGHLLEPEAAPGNTAGCSVDGTCASSLGLEFDLSLFYEEKGRFNFDIQAGVFVPVGPSHSAPTEEDPTATTMFSPFDYAVEGSDLRYHVSDVAFTFQARMTLQF